MTKSPKKPPFAKVPRNFHENRYWQEQMLVTGIDEVGRGCLAGPVVTGAVILPLNTPESHFLIDSKKLSATERQEAYEWIIAHCLYATGIINHRIIDKQNIWQATLLGMKRALVQLLAHAPHKPGAILVDAMPLTLDDTAYRYIPVLHFPFGEDQSCSIAAASIVAKVTRDQLMKQLNPVFPGYNFDQHKGYATIGHKAAIVHERPSIIHRHTFLSNTLASTNTPEPHEHQQTLC